jgi:TonB-dependent receptor
VKVGGSYTDKDRSFRQRRFVYEIDGGLDYDENPAHFFGDLGGIIGTGPDGAPVLGNIIQESTRGRNNYNGAQTVTAGFAMVDVPFGPFLENIGVGEVPLLSRLRVIGGVRVEQTEQSIDVYEGDLTYPLASESFEEAARIEATDWLPSVNLVYGLTDAMNLRAAYGRTLARPSFREFSTSCFTLFIVGYQLCGANIRSAGGESNLDRTLVNNFDVRWEWFPDAGELLAVSGFYKDFENAIVRTFVPVNNPTLTFINAPSASVYGLEVEARKRLGFLGDLLGGREWLQHFNAGANVTLTRSDSQVPVENSVGETVLVDRPLQGQSPYLVNANLSYENPDHGTSASIYYNVFGRRLSEITRDAALIEAASEAPDRYEQARHTLDLTLSQTFRPVGLRSLKIKFKAKNLLGEEHEVAREYRGHTYPVERYELGRTFTLGLEYSL